MSKGQVLIYNGQGSGGCTGDKDFFSHYLETVTEIFSENNITIFVNFIGPIEDLNTYNKIIKYCTKHGII